MRYDKLVPSNGLPISSEEIDMWKSFIEESFSELGASFKHMNTVYFNHDDKYDYTEDHVILTFRIDNVPSEVRDWDKNRILGLTEVYFTLFKETGYLDETDYTSKPVEKKFNYKDAPEYQWSMSVATNGSMIMYRRKTRTDFSLPRIYQYGTELSDFDYKETVRYLKYLIKE